MENNFDDFIKYRAELRYNHFNNNKYKSLTEFCNETVTWNLWDTNFFRLLFKIPCTTPDMQSSKFEAFLKNELTHPTVDWINIFDYIASLEKHPYFNEYLDSYINDSGSFIRDPLFWSILNKYKDALIGQISNNQQIWI